LLLPKALNRKGRKVCAKFAKGIFADFLRPLLAERNQKSHIALQPHLRHEVPMSKVNIAEKFSKIPERWKPHIVGELNGQQVKLVKSKGEFVFHHHENEDEMFLVVKGRFRMDFRDRHEWIEEGEFIVVPRGVEHRPVAEEECWILLFEPASTLNTGNVENELTQRQLERV
jgi:mannose-6-phosphate isomerase-like protein (cupin superfamily)